MGAEPSEIGRETRNKADGHEHLTPYLLGASVMKCRNAWSVPGSPTRASIGLIDLRRLSLSRPSSYRRNAPHCATWPKHDSNGSSHRHKRSSHFGALRGAPRTSVPKCRNFNNRLS